MGSIRAFIKKNRLNYIGISIILIITVAIGMMFLELNQQMASSVLNIKKYTNMEEFSFYPILKSEDIMKVAGHDYSLALQNKAEELSQQYDFSFESHAYKVVKNDDQVIRFYQEGRTIDKLYVIDGTDSPSNGCVLIDYGYADYHNLSVGDSITVDSKDYKISGIVLYPDKLAPIVDNTGLLYNCKSQVILTLSTADFAQLNIKENYEFVGIGGETFDLNALQEDSSIYAVIAAEENPQILKTVASKSSINTTVLCFAMTLLFSIVALLLIMTIFNSINTEAPRLGVMKALGFSNFEISRKYFLFFFMIFLPCAIGYGLGFWLLPYFSSIMLSDMALPVSRANINYIIAAILVFVPAAVFSVLAYLVSILKVRKPALELIRSGGKKRENWIVRRINKGITTGNYLTGIRKTVLYSRLFVLFFVIFGGFALGVQIQFAFTMYNMTDSLTSEIMEGVNYSNTVHYAQTVDDADIADTDLLFHQQSVRFDTAHGDSFSVELCVLQNEESNLLELVDKNGTPIQKQNVDGIIINDWMRIHYGLAQGDQVIIRIGSVQCEVEVAAVSNNIYGNTVYTHMSYATKTGLVQEETYNGLYTNRDVVFDAQKHLSVTSNAEVTQSVENSSRIYTVLSVFFLVTGIVIGLAMLVLSMNTVVTNYQKYISLMKILGYSEWECSKVIKGFRTASLIGYVVSIPYSFILCWIMFSIVSNTSDIIYNVRFDIFSTIICFAVTAFITEIVLAAFLRKIRKISFRMVMES